MSNSIAFMEKMIKKFNDRGDYYIGDELSWALDDLKSLEQQLSKAQADLKLAEEALNNYAIADDVGSIARKYFKNKELKQIKDNRDE